MNANETSLAPERLPAGGHYSVSVLKPQCLAKAGVVPCRRCGTCGGERSTASLRRPAGVSRHELIATAKLTFAREHTRNPALRIAESDWIGAALRVNGEPELGRGELDPAGVSLLPASRDELIRVARIVYEAEIAGGRIMLASERAFVDQVLRDRGLPLLSDTEAAELESGAIPVPTPAPTASFAAARESHSAGADRPAQIAKARRTYRDEVASGRTVLCSERAWVNTALRDQQQSRLTDGEVWAFAIADA